MMGCNIETIRYYEKIGLLHDLNRTESGHRTYSVGDQKRLKFILRCRELGFSIEDLRSLLNLVDGKAYTCGDVLAVTNRHISEIESKISDLLIIKQTLSNMSLNCVGGDVPECPVIYALFGD